MIENKIATHLLTIGAVKLQPQDPFTWTSGIQSPIYCDNRQIISFPEVRTEVAEAIAKWIQEEVPDAEVIAGTATAGIPHAAWIAQILNLPMIYVRSKPKEHGTGSQIEGVLNKGQKVVLIEDLISTGGSSLQAVEAIRRDGGIIDTVCSIFTYDLPKAKRQFDANHCRYMCLSNFPSLVQTAIQRGDIQAEDEQIINSWYEELKNN